MPSALWCGRLDSRNAQFRTQGRGIQPAGAAPGGPKCATPSPLSQLRSSANRPWLGTSQLEAQRDRVSAFRSAQSSSSSTR